MTRHSFMAMARSVILATSLIAMGTGTIFAQESEVPALDPENPEFTQFVEQPELSILQAAESDITPGLVPEPFILPEVSLNIVRAAAVLPASYDLRTQNKLTAIRDQGSCGSCWSFAAMGSLESSMMPGESLNLSENNLKNKAGFDISCCSGGNRTMSAAYLARWGGAISESDDPYNPGSCTSPAAVSPIKHVQEILYIPTRVSSLDNDAIKQAVMTYGAVYTTYYHSGSYYKSTTRGYYYNGSTAANHAVCIVGWDDNYSASNFVTTAPGNGAFLIRNSWGTYWGQSGYFWMSYYDSRLGKSENAVFRGEPANNFSRIYQYDTLGWITNAGYGSSTAYLASVFTAVATEPIAAASWYAPSAGSTYTLSLYVNPTNGPVNSTGPVATQTGTFNYAGYHTARFATPVTVSAGQKFSVVVKVNTPGYNYPVPLERPYSGYSSAARANAGETYMSSNGTSWSDVANSYSNSSVCLKAFAGGSAAPPQPTPGSLSVSPTTALSSTGTEGGSFTPSSQAYTLSNPGDTAINWTASKGATWLTLSAASGTLAAGATTTVSAMINSIANSLTAGSYTDTVTFTNTTNSTGNTSRSVSLTVTSPTPGPGKLFVSPTTTLASTGAVGGPFTPASQSYTLSNSGDSSVSWSASKTASWISLSSTGGTLAAGGSATLTATINSAANTLAAGTYTDTLVINNTTNGDGNATRGVSLTVTSGTTPPAPTGEYRVETATYSWIDPTSHMRVPLIDNSGTSVAMAFPFTLYGKTYSRLYIGSNGVLSFGSSSITSQYNVNIPYIYAPNAAIYPYWDDLNPGVGGSIYIGTVGTAPNRKAVVSWVGVPNKANTTVKYTFQAILCEGTNDVVFQYLDVTPANTLYGAGRSATIGIEDSTGKLACKVGCNTYGAVNNSRAYRITNKVNQTMFRYRR